MEFRILGPLEVLEEGRAVALGGGKQRALLAVLLLHANEPLTTDRLIDELWGEHPPPTAAKAVHVHVSRLRKALATGAGNGGAGGGLVVTRERGYELRLAPERLDSRRFEQLVAEGRSELADGRPQRALAALEQALALWRGEPLADLAYEPFAQAEIARLEELRVAALEQLVESKLALGRHAEVVGELEALIGDHSYREGLRAQLMLALYRCDRQAEALQAYHDARSALVELGIEPGERLRELERAILAQDPALAAPAPATVELPPELDAATPLAGREAELGWLREQWRRTHAGAGRLVLVFGARGMGKTRLAAELAAEVLRERGGVLYASGAGPSEVACGVLGAARKAGRRTLVVLDDVDLAGPELLAALCELLDELAALPVLVVATAEGLALAPPLGTDATLALAPLDVDAVRLVARSYAGARDDVEIPAERLAAASGGVPRRVHRAANEWARAEAVRRLGTSAGRAASERTDLRGAEDELAGDVVELEALRARAEPEGGERDVVTCPFKGLASFDVEDAEVFFGRERLVAEMVARLAGAPLVGIVGSSGSGKSSALRAGLLAALAGGALPGSERWTLALLRPGEHPQRALERATEGAAPEGTLVVAVDQFEEVFTACRDESERAAFVAALVAATRDPRRRALVLIAVRADFYGRCAVFPELSRLLGANHVLVGPMRRDELRRAIEQPARRAGLRVDSDLVDALIADVEGEPGALPLLSTSLLELWQRRDGQRLRLSAYEQAGGVHGAVAHLAESSYARLEPAERDLARRILLRLAGEGEGEAVVRRRVELAELGADRDEAVGRVLAALASDRLVTIGEGEVEVAHEALLREWPRLRGWLEDDAEGRRLHHHLRAAAKEWDTGGRDPGELYRGARLASALDWATDHDAELNDFERSFLDDSRAASGRAQRRLRAGLVALAAMLALAVIAGLVALNERGKARDEAVAADAQRLGALALVEDDLDRALLLARQGVALNETVQTRGNLLAALLKSPAAIGVIRADTGRFEATALSPDGRTLAVGNSPGRVLLFDTRTRQRVATLKPATKDARIFELAYSPDGHRLAIGHLDYPDGASSRAVTVLHLRTRQSMAKLTLDTWREVSGMQFSPDGRTLGMMTLSDRFDGSATFMRFDASTGRRILAPVRVNRRGWSPLMITSDGRRMVVPGDDGVTLRDANTLAVLCRLSGIDLNPSVTSSWAQDTVSSPYALSSDDHIVALGDEDGSVRLLDLRNRKTRTLSGGHEGAVREARFAPDGRRLITTGEDGDVIVWNVRTAAAAETLRGHAGPVFSPQISQDGTTLFTASRDGTVVVWDLGGGRRLGRPFRLGRHPAGFPALSTDGRVLAIGGRDGAISSVEGDALKPHKPLQVARTGWVFGIAFLPGSHHLIVGGLDSLPAVIDIDRGRIVRRLRGDRQDILGGSISADGRLLATIGGDRSPGGINSLIIDSDDSSVRLWSLPQQQPLGAPLRFRSALVDDAQLSPDGRWLAIALLELPPPGDPSAASGSVKVWDVRRRRVVARMRFERETVTQFSPDGRLLATGGAHGRARVWSTENWEPVTRPFGGHTDAIAGVAIDRDGRTLATGSSDGTVRLWDIEAEQAIGAPLPGLPNLAVMPSFTPDGTRLIATYDSGEAYRWDIGPDSLVRQACRVAGRRLTRAEWTEFLPGRDYDPAC
jgi:WD40 repeat protein/DNA-binding SARP family transcriptional activator